MRWNALKTKAENATKELAANLQEQRDRFVESRVKAQAEKNAVQTSVIDGEQHEEALRIVQYQNKALRYVITPVGCVDEKSLPARAYISLTSRHIGTNNRQGSSALHRCRE